MKNNINNYDKAYFSVVMIDLKQYTQVLLNLDTYLADANFILNSRAKEKLKPTDYAGLLKEYVLKPYGRVDGYLKNITAKILKQQDKLANFFEQNPQCKDEFYAQLDILIPLIEDQKKVIKEQLKKCFNHIKEANSIESLEDENAI